MALFCSGKLHKTCYVGTVRHPVPRLTRGCMYPDEMQAVLPRSTERLSVLLPPARAIFSLWMALDDSKMKTSES